jgi:catechol 2,3-dioxygenase-like lactoylglutathione lyase family enzyme
MTDLTVLPVLRSSDLDETSTFYAEQLGFTPERVAPDYLIMRRDQIELHFCPPDHPQIYAADGTGPLETEARCYIRGAGIDALHDEFVARNVLGFRGFVKTPWNMFEFYVSDPNGVLLVFGRSATEGPAPTSLS